VQLGGHPRVAPTLVAPDREQLVVEHPVPKVRPGIPVRLHRFRLDPFEVGVLDADERLDALMVEGEVSEPGLMHEQEQVEPLLDSRHVDHVLVIQEGARLQSHPRRALRRLPCVGRDVVGAVKDGRAERSTGFAAGAGHA
jgi:hypothetical protein